MTKVLLVLIALTLSACATPSQESADAQSRKVYRTGSNLPSRDGVSDAKTVDPTTLQNRPPAAVPGR